MTDRTQVTEDDKDYIVTIRVDKELHQDICAIVGTSATIEQLGHAIASDVIIHLERYHSDQEKIAASPLRRSKI